MSTETKQSVEVTPAPAGSEPATQRSARLFGPIEEAERLFERLMSPNWLRTMHWNWPLWGALEERWSDTRVPSLDIVDRDRDMLVRFEMPGVERKDLSVTLTDHVLKIEGRVKHEEQVVRGETFRCEIQQGDYIRKLSVPDVVDASKITATLKDGILEVVMPKFENLQRRAIQVK